MNFKKKIYLIVIKFIDFLIISLNRFQIYIEKKIDSLNIFNFEDLTSNIVEGDLKESQKTYLDSLKWAVLNKNINNVALTGFYGTGKSTIINTFLKKNKGFKSLKISLSKFDSSKYDESEIEVSILQQIFYSKKQSLLSDSRLKRITNNKYIFYKVLMFFLWTVSLLYIFFPNIIQEILLKNEVLCDYIYAYILPFYNIISILSIIWFCIGVFYIIRYVYIEIINLKINKLSIKDLELTPKDQNKESLLNKNIDEIIYFFEKTKVKLVVIEDLDRFENPKILIKLRELNSLINNCEDIEFKVTFIYAIKDEIFSHNTRTKFFDFIIPLIPIINYDNSYEILSRKLEVYKIDDDFLKNVSPYVNDMRTLKNIVNEFKVYENIIFKKESELNVISQVTETKTETKTETTIENESISIQNKIVDEKVGYQKLLALIIYKNYYPDDFTYLQKQKGIVYSIFDNKKDLFKTIESEKEIEIQKLKDKCTQIENESINDIITLRKIYLYELYKLFNQGVTKPVKQIVDEGIYFHKDDLLKDENFTKLIKSTNIRYCQYEPTDNWSSYNTNSNISFKTIETIVNPDFKYTDREAIIKDKTVNSISNLTKRIFDMEDAVQKLIYLNLAETTQHVNISVVDKYLDGKILSKLNDKKPEEDITKFDLLKVLLKEGYLDEHYIDYVSYFHEGSLSLKDNNLKKQIIEQDYISFDQKFDNVERLIEKLAVNNFKKYSILNYEILECLIDSGKIENKKLDLFVDLLKKEEFILYEFIKGYMLYLKNKFKNNDKLIAFLLLIVDRNDNFWDILSKNGLEKELSDVVMSIMITYNSDEELLRQNINSSLSYYINNCDNFLTLIKTEKYFSNDDLVKTLETLKVKFRNLEFNEEHKSLFKKIYEKNLYQINSKMISEILLSNKDFESSEMKEEYKVQIYNSNLTTIYDSGISTLITNVNQNITEYINEVLLAIESNADESEQTIIKLLANDIDLELKNKIILKQNTKIKEILEVSSDLWYILFTNNKIEAKWENLFHYFDEFDSLDGLEVFLNIEENYKTLSESVIGDDSEEKENKFIKKLINLEISNDSFNNIVKSIDIEYEDISILGLENLYKISTLIYNGKINPTNENINYIYNKGSNKYVDLIEHNEEKFNSDFEEFNLNDDVIYNLIVDGYLLEETLKKIFNRYEDNIILFSVEKLNNIAIKLNSINYSDYNYPFYNKLLDSASEMNTRINLVIVNFSDLDDDNEVYNSLDKINNDFSKVRLREPFEVIDNPENRKLLELLKGKYIKNYYPKKNGNISISYPNK